MKMDVQQIKAGPRQSFVILAAGGIVFGCGSNRNKELGLDTKIVYHLQQIPISSPVKEIAAGFKHTVFLTDSN